MTNYYYSTLSANGKKLYTSVVDAARNCRSYGGIPNAVEKDEVLTIFNAVVFDNPELMHLNCTQMSYDLCPAKIHLSYMYSESEAQGRIRRLNYEADEIIKRIGDLKTRSKQMICLYLHNYLMRTITYDNDAINEYTTCPDSYSAYGALINKRAVCQGISLAFKLLCDKTGVPCFVVRGEVVSSNGEKRPHSWNMVYIDGKYAHIDVTWDLSMSLASGCKRFDYFLVNEEDIKVDRSFKYQYPHAADTSGLGYFYSTGSYLKNKSELRNFISQQAETKPEFICFKLEKSQYLTDTVIDTLLKKVDNAVAGILTTGGQYYTIHNKNQLVFFYGIEYPHRST